ncbi:MAG: hypothetical protein COC24_005195 [Alphaproteobacteria bacterium]|nr:hypothetical protein [Alphaproteobacteria bacterium]
MSDNTEMVLYFIREFYRAKKSNLADMVSRTFRFKPPSKPELTFDEYMTYIDRFANSVNLIVHGISSDDDMVFKVDYTIETLSVKGGLGIEIKGCAVVKLLDEQIDYVEIINNTSELDPVKIANFRAELNKN